MSPCQARKPCNCQQGEHGEQSVSLESVGTGEVRGLPPAS